VTLTHLAATPPKLLVEKPVKVVSKRNRLSESPFRELGDTSLDTDNARGSKRVALHRGNSNP
jgi:hypothetical protein